MKNPKASIFIPTKNAGKEFEIVLNQISKQNEKNFEIIIVDSGSTNNTLQIVENFVKKNKDIPLVIHQIKPENFGHGKTRNLSLKYAKAPYIVFLTQDAVPANNQWLSSLLANFKDPKVAGTFSRQIPKKNARETEKIFCCYYFSDQKIITSLKNNVPILNVMFFSNASSCIKKSVLKKYPFDESLIMTEDQEWAKRIIEKGYKKIYEPKSVVIHSHNYTLKQIFQRYFDSAFSIKQILNKNFNRYVKSARIYPTQELKYILKVKPYLIFRSVIENILKILATKLGQNANKLPFFIKRRLSMHKNFWKKMKNGTNY